ncbi:MAG TPA: SRPBCC family protein, partial [Pseudolabrys sp.]
IESRRMRGIEAIPDAGRKTTGPAGSGHARTADLANVGRGEAPTSKALPPRTAAEAVEGPFAPVGDLTPQLKLVHHFIVRHPREDVWAFFASIKDVAACLPGASITGGDNRSVTGKLRIKVGPIAAEFEGIAIVEYNPSDYSGTIRGSGRDTRGRTAARGAISYRAVPAENPQSTRVDISIAYALTGALAQFSRTELMQDVVKQVIKSFVQNLEARLAAPGQSPSAPAVELNAGSVVFSVMAERVKGWFRKLLGRTEA